MAVTVGSPSEFSTYANNGPQLLASGKITRHAAQHRGPPRADAQVSGRDVQQSDHRPVARAELGAHRGQPRRGAKSADESMVLLENHNNALPLKRTRRRSRSSARSPTIRSTSSARTCRSATTPTRAISARSTRSSRSSTGSRPRPRTPPSTTQQGCDTTAPTRRFRRRGRRRQRPPTSPSSSSASRRRTAARPRRGRSLGLPGQTSCARPGRSPRPASRTSSC